MLRAQVGDKLYFTVDHISTMSWLTRQEARDNRSSNAVLIEHVLTPGQRKGLETIIDELYEAN